MEFFSRNIKNLEFPAVEGYTLYFDRSMCADGIREQTDIQAWD